MNLNKVFYLIITFLLSSNAFGQSEKILGSWKPFAVDNGEFYMNIKNDSISLYKEFDYVRNDSLKIKQMKDVVSQIYFSQKHIFKENGKYIQDLFMANFEFDYKVDQSRNLILTFENQFKNNKNALEIPYKLENNILYLEIPLTETVIKLWLKK
ncbi:MAG: hypothetical protein JKY08_05865 [Flavobacteriaceae bacterium]|nr:hypothetical protein [Flavobacteriaceae bacterium]